MHACVHSHRSELLLLDEVPAAGRLGLHTLQGMRRLALFWLRLLGRSRAPLLLFPASHSQAVTRNSFEKLKRTLP